MIRSTLDVTGLLAAVRPTLARLAAEVAPRPTEASSPDQLPGTDGGPASARSVAVDTRRAIVLRRALEEWGVRCCRDTDDALEPMLLEAERKRRTDGFSGEAAAPQPPILEP